MKGVILWWDERDGHGVILGVDARKYYTDSSSCYPSPKSKDVVLFEENKAIPTVLCAHNVKEYGQ